MRWGLSKVKPDSIAAKMAAKSIGKNISTMGKQFITGETIDEAAKVMFKGRQKDGVAWTVKILKDIGVDYAQGYGIDMPAPLAERLHSAQARVANS